MNTFSYPVTLEAQDDGSFIVDLVDFPNAHTGGQDRDEALQEAADCLAEAIAGRMNHGEPVPAPSPAERGDALVPVPVDIAAKAAVYVAMREQSVTADELAARLDWVPSRVHELLDPRQDPRLDDVEAALSALGKRPVFSVEGAA
jgi:antitoxin HicB